MNNKFTNVSKKIITYWIIKRLSLLIPPTGLLISALVIDDIPFSIKLLLFIFSGLFYVIVILSLIIFPHLEYKKYLYLIKEDEVIFMRGVLFKSSIVVPIIQMQDVGFYQGPVAQFLGIASINISTAGSNLVIDGIKKEDAETIVNELKEKIKKYVEARNEAKR